MSLASTLLALPILTIVSIPLLLSAWVTVSLALITLTLRLGVVYIELSYALLVNFLKVPTTTSSLFTFTASEPSSPAAGRSRRNSGYGLAQPSRSKDPSRAWALNEIHEDMAKHQRKRYARSMVEAHNTSYGLPNSGSEWRDFEGVGGWRPYSRNPRGSKSLLEKRSTPPSASPAQSPTGDMNLDIDIEADERAWLSINYRLELPSQVVTLGTSSATTSNVTSPIHMGYFDDRKALHSNALMSTSKTRHNPNSGRPRHHQRSHTTSSLTTCNSPTGGGLSLSLSTRPDRTGHRREHGHHLSPITSRMVPFKTPQPYSHIHTRTLADTSHPDGHRSSSVEGPRSSPIEGSADRSSVNCTGSYFALHRPRKVHIPKRSNTGSPGSSGLTTPTSMESRDTSSLQLARWMAHHPVNFRHRRRSISGPHSRANPIE